MKDDTDAAKLTRVEDAVRQIKAKLRSNAYPAGFTATEPEIAESLGMSRTPVREALLRVAAEGLIEVVPRRGMRVLPLKPRDLGEIYEILTALEPVAAAALAMRGLSRQDLQQLEQPVVAMENALQRDDLDTWAKADDAFHSALLDLHGNARMQEVVARVYDQAHRARVVTLRLRPVPRQSTVEHREIFTHILNGDATAAHAAFTRHRERSRKELLAVLDKLDGAGGY